MFIATQCLRGQMQNLARCPISRLNRPVGCSATETEPATAARGYGVDLTHMSRAMTDAEGVMLCDAVCMKFQKWETLSHAVRKSG